MLSRAGGFRGGGGKMAANVLRAVRTRYIEPGSAVPLFATMGGLFCLGYTMELVHHLGHGRAERRHAELRGVALEAAAEAARARVQAVPGEIREEERRSQRHLEDLAASRKRLMALELERANGAANIAKADKELAEHREAQAKAKH